MSYEFPVNPDNWMVERKGQFVSMGVAAADVDTLRGVINDMWADGPGGWCYEWSKLAQSYRDAGDPFQASLAYGCARFPCLADPPKARALELQTEQYQLAAAGFPVAFERRIVNVTYQASTVDVPVHVLSPGHADGDTPVLIASGGIDSWKMDLHSLWVALALGAGVRVVAFDHAGVGDLTQIPLRPGTDQIIDDLIDFARTLTRGKVGHFGASFGGYFSALSGLRGKVDAAIVMGGPVTSASFGPGNARKLMFGMDDIFGNAIGFTAKPDTDTLAAAFAPFAADQLLTTHANSPMLVINGDKDPYVPTADTTIFAGRPDTTTQLIPGATHCAFDKLDTVLPTITGWGHPGPGRQATPGRPHPSDPGITTTRRHHTATFTRPPAITLAPPLRFQPPLAETERPFRCGPDDR
jgi:esterase FrsA